MSPISFTSMSFASSCNTRQEASDPCVVDHATLIFGLWGVTGAAANLGVVFLEASRRVKGWPWVLPHGPGGGVYAASVMIHLGIAACTTAATSTAEIVSSGFVAFGIGAAAPVAVKKIARSAQGLLPDREDRNDPPGEDNSHD
jgi:hypothetical protein